MNPRAVVRTKKGTFAVPQTPGPSTTRVGLFRTRRIADAESNATDNKPSDQACQEVARRLIPPTPRSSTLASSVTTLLYNTTGSLSLTATVIFSDERASQNSPTQQSVNSAGGTRNLGSGCVVSRPADRRSLGAGAGLAVRRFYSLLVVESSDPADGVTRSDIVRERSCAVMKSVTAYSVGAPTRRTRITAPSIERALKMAVDGKPRRARTPPPAKGANEPQ